MSIPKIIHYCWLSNDPVPKVFRNYIDGWHKLLPDYEFIKWDFSRFEKSSSAWVSEAFENKKYAFAADFIRIFAVYNYGGIYMDMDIEVLKSFNDLINLPDHPYMFARERPDKDWIEAGCFGAEKGNEILRKCLDYYKERHFIKSDGTFDTLPLPRVMDKVLKENHIKIELYPWKFFTAKSYDTGIESPDETTYAIHHFAGSWKSVEEQKMIEKAQHLRNTIPVIGSLVAFVYEKSNKAVHALKTGGVKELTAKVRQFIRR